ncbi:MAG: ThiF family adenylyltransferase [Bacillota bacterium]|nr:ThiF family adenylyltransferase [Bacillota bacterium]
MNTQVNKRYAKQILFRPISKKGQTAIAASKVTIIGLGALGTVSSNQLCRAGVGHLKLVDRDFVEYSNLQRQILFDEKDASKVLPKAIAAAEKLSAANSEIVIEPLVADLSPGNAEKIIAESSLVVDGTDNLETRLLINDVCVKNNIPWIYGAVLGSVGMTMSIVPDNTPCLRCHIEHLPTPGSIPSCDTEGVLSMATGTVASIQSAEALRLLVGLEPTQGMLYIDIWDRDFETIHVEKRKECPTCGKKVFDFLNGESYSWTTVLCGRNAVQIMPPAEKKIDLKRLSERLEAIGKIAYNGYLLTLQVENKEIVLFPNGRAIIHGTDNEAEARTIFARYIGI